MAKKKKLISWNKESSYSEDRDPRTKVVNGFKGKFFLHGICFKFATSICNKAKYILRVTFTIISPVTGHILHRLGDYSDKTCTGDIYISRDQATMSDKAIKDLIVQKALDMYDEFYDEIRNASLGQQSTATAKLLFLWHTYKEKWMRVSKRTRSQSDRRWDETARLMGEYFALLDVKPVAELLPADIEAARGVFSKNAAKAESLGKDFWDYCSMKGIIAPDISNPFDTVVPFPRKSNRKSSASGQKVSLSTEQEKILRSIIRERFKTNPLYVGVCLIAYGGLAVAEIFALTWDRIILSPTDMSLGYVRILDKTHSYATHDFTRPLMPFAVEILREYGNFLLSLPGMTEKKLNSRPVIFSLNPAVQYSPKSLTSLCRDIMPSIRVSYEVIAAAGSSSSTSQAGITILQATYRNILAEICKMAAQDPDAYAYMQSRSLTGKVTADHYRSFSSHEGLMILQKYLKRDIRFLPDSAFESKVIDLPAPDGTIVKEVTGIPASCDVTVTLKPGETITVSSGCRIKGTWKDIVIKQEDMS